MDWMSTNPPIPTTNPARYIAPTIFAVVLYVFIPSAPVGVLEGVFGSASFRSCFVNTVASPYSRPGKGRGSLEVAVPDPEGGQEAILRLRRAFTFTYRYRAWFLDLTSMKQRLQERHGI